MCDTDCFMEVAVRIRPLQNDSASQDLFQISPTSKQLKIKGSDKIFLYNHIFDTNTTQQALYNSCIKDKLEQLFKGYNVTVIAYGCAASGKTYTMGTVYPGKDDTGVIPQGIKDIFAFVKDSFCYDFTITVSFMELFQETFFDLLASNPREQCSVDVKEDSGLPGLTEHIVSSAVEALQLLRRGSERRSTKSRSHAFFTINVCMQKRGTSEPYKTAKFLLVDLVGLERSKNTRSVGSVRDDTNVDEGLVALENIISVLSDEESENCVNYANSNLTRVLKDSIGGNSITLMIACVSSADCNLDETLSTLQYAHIASKIKNKPVENFAVTNSQLKYGDKVGNFEARTIRSNGDSNYSFEINERHKVYSKQQTAIINELLKVTLLLSSKELLVQQIGSNYPSYSVDCSAIPEITTKVESLKKEKDKLLQKMAADATDEITERRRKHFQRLECEIQDLRAKIIEQERSLKMKNDAELQMEQLNNEITAMTKKKVELITTMSADFEKFRTWSLGRKRGLQCFGVHDQKRKKLEAETEMINGSNDASVDFDKGQDESRKLLDIQQQQIIDLKQKIDKLEKENEKLKSNTEKSQNKENVDPVPLQEKNATHQPAAINGIKRSKGGCGCKGKCSTRVCGCRKTTSSCTASCKCEETSCSNRDESK